MSGYLASIVQRGAGIAQPAAVAAPMAPAPAPPGSSYALEAPPMESIGAQPALPAAPLAPPSAHDAGDSPLSIYSVPVHPEVTTRVDEPRRERVESRVEVAVSAGHENRVAHSESSVIRTEVVQVPTPADANAVPRAPESHLVNSLTSAAPHRASAPAVKSVSPDAPRTMGAGSPILLPAAARELPAGDASGESSAPTPAIVEVTLQPAPQPRVEISPRAATPPASAPEALPIHVRIGKIEVKPPAPAVPAAPSTPKAGTALGFDRYRRLRTYRS